MATLTVTSTSTNNIAVPQPVGVIAPGATASFDVSTSEIDDMRAELVALEDGGYITFTVSVDTDASAAELAASFMPASQVLETSSAQAIGAFTVTLAATQTNTAMALGAVAVGWTAPRAGSITGLSVASVAAPTTAGCDFRVSVNGTPIAGTSAVLTHSPALANVAVSFARDTYTFAAGDIIRVVYTSGGIGNTPVAVAFVEVTC